MTEQRTNRKLQSGDNNNPEKIKKVIQKKHYLTNCISSTATRIDAMVDDAKEISYRTFLKHVSYSEISSLFPYYQKDSRLGLTLRNDWAVSFFKSKYDHQECVFICHSAIEYIFI